MDYSKWIEQLLKNTGKYVSEHKDEIIIRTKTAVGVGIVSSMIWVSHEEKAKTEAEKKGYEKAAITYGKKYKELLHYINELERKISQPNQEAEQLIDDIIEEYELTVRKLLQMCKSELTKLEENNNRSAEENEYMISLVNDYANYKLKLYGENSTSDIYFMIGNIAYLDVDCIVNAANKTLLGGGGVDGAIHKAAGEGLLQECKTLNGCNVGEAKITKGYKLPAKYVIHTVGPIYKGNRQDEANLASCYVSSLELAKKNNIHTIAFPAISTGHYGYPLKEASEIALGTISKWLVENENYPMAVIMCSYDEKTYEVYKSIWSEATTVELGNQYTSVDAHNTKEKADKTAEVNVSKFEGLGFGIIHKTCDVVMDGNKGSLVWDYIVYNEISFVNDKTRETKSLFQSISDNKTEKEFERLSEKYSVGKKNV